MKTVNVFLALVSVWVLSACAPGPSEAAFVQACMAQRSPGIGVTEEMCQCGAREAKDTLPPKLVQAMILHMEGKKQESEALLGDMSFDDRAEFGMKQFAILGKCLGKI